MLDLTLTWDAADRTLTLDEPALDDLNWPSHVELVHRAGGAFTMRGHDVPAPGSLALSHPDDPNEGYAWVAFGADTAAKWPKKVTTYTGWYDADEECLYAVPAPERRGELVTLTITLTPQEYRLLAQLAIVHQVVPVDISRPSPPISRGRRTRRRATAPGTVARTSGCPPSSGSIATCSPTGGMMATGRSSSGPASRRR
jgi:hypothetical protein